MENAKQSGTEQIVATTLPVEDAEQAGTEARLVAGRALVGRIEAGEFDQSAVETAAE